MKKVVLATTLCAALCGTMLAEENGAFVGLDLGFNGGKVTSTFEDSTENITQDYKSSVLSYGLVGGYKHFLNDNIGFRGYINLTHAGDFSIKDKTSNAEVGTVSSDHIGLNADVLYNFLTQDQFDLGVYAGLNLSYAFNTFKTPADEYNPATKEKLNGFDMGINFGLRSTIATNHSIELWSKFNLIGPKKEEQGQDEYFDGTTNQIDSWKQSTTFSQPYAVGLRYTYNF